MLLFEELTKTGVIIHQMKEHLDWLDAAVIAETEASQKGRRSKGQRTEERSEDLVSHPVEQLRTGNG